MKKWERVSSGCAVAISPDGAFLYAAQAGGSVQQCDAATGQVCAISACPMTRVNRDMSCAPRSLFEPSQAVTKGAWWHSFCPPTVEC